MDEKTETRRLKLFYWNREADKSLQATRDSAGSSAVAVHVFGSRDPKYKGTDKLLEKGLDSEG